MTAWNTVKVYECPDCGEWVRDMHDACTHVCAWKKTSIEMGEDLKLLSEIETVETKLKSTPFYEFSKRRQYKFKIRELDAKRDELAK